MLASAFLGYLMGVRGDKDLTLIAKTGISQRTKEAKVAATLLTSTASHKE